MDCVGRDIARLLSDHAEIEIAGLRCGDLRERGDRYGNSRSCDFHAGHISLFPEKCCQLLAALPAGRIGSPDQFRRVEQQSGECIGDLGDIDIDCTA